jgi:4'-phosphopantetheinyl transferase
MLDVWVADLAAGASSIERLTRLLSVDELQRANAYRADTDRCRFIAARAALRLLLAECLPINPSEIEFVYSSQGKPSLANSSDTLHFNIAHAHELAILAFSRSDPVGADIEFLATEVDTAALSERVFSANEKHVFARLDPTQRHTAFLRAWTRKEAIAKAYGAGLALPFRTLEVPLEALSHPRHTERHSLFDLPVPSAYVASVAMLRDATLK